MPGTGRAILVAILVAIALVCFVLGLINLRRRRHDQRLRELTEGDAIAPNGATPAARPGSSPALWSGLAVAASALPKIGTPLLPDEEDDLTELESRLRKAGYYQRHAAGIFLGIKVLLLVAAVLFGLGMGVTGFLTPVGAMLCGGFATGVAVLAPGLWVEGRTRTRQETLRRALPDALDVMVICVEGGLSLPEAIRRVAGELQTAHPLLAGELGIVQREILLGLSPGEAMRRLATRCDIEEVRSLAAVLLQSERFGASTSKALRVQADQLRLKRHQRAEERAQRAAVLILFPTLLCIFPAVFLVFLGPAVWRILDMFERIK
jgi:tight adherence protein C